MKNKLILALTPGDPSGIGPEITWKAIQSGYCEKNGIQLLCIGAKVPFQKLNAPIIEFSEDNSYSENLKHQRPFVWLYPAPEVCPEGLLLEGFQTGWSIRKATELVLNRTASALVTGPISKERLQKGGFHYPGHTEFLAHLCQTSAGTPEVTMMLANQVLRVSLVTIHMSLQEVPAALSRKKVRRAILQTIEGLQKYWGIEKPQLAVTALNPHGGEGGRFGNEEIDIIYPELNALSEEAKGQFTLFGPLPADTLFAKHLLQLPENQWDAVVCMYHDQGLIPVKLLDFHNTVNITLGLPIIRTSVDHGVAFDIVGKNIANASSLKSAIKLAAQFAQRERKVRR